MKRILVKPIEAFLLTFFASFFSWSLIFNTWANVPIQLLGGLGLFLLGIFIGRL